MIQKKFLCKDIGAVKEAVGQICGILRDTPHKSALVTFYETGLTRGEIDGLVEDLRRSGTPQLQIAGISLTIIAELMPEGTGVLLNLILTDEADMEVVSVPCMPGEEAEAAGKLRARLDNADNVRAVELFGSNMSINTTRFIEKAMEGHEDVVLFGTSTIRGLMQKITVDEGGDNLIDVEQIDPSSVKEELIFGGEILYDGFVAVVFSGEDLKVRADYALGWNPIGRSLPLELGEDPEMGETVVNRIYGLPAVDIYREYLGVYPDAYLISNICEFPLVVERDGINICMVPLTGGKDGELYFMMTLREGEKLRFTFASHDEVLAASRRSLENQERFQPQALFLTLCGNRINFLKEDAHLEWDSFKSVGPDNVIMHGACELFYHKGKGGILNSAHLAIGLREGEADSIAEYEHPTLESLRHGRTLSLSDRMSVFLSKITTELIDIAAQADSANKAKSAFLSHMSHEIRTPINAILGMDEMILQESQDEETIEYAESIRSAGNNMLGIVNDILDFSKIEAGKMKIVAIRYDLTSVLNDLYNVVRLRAADKGLEVKLDIDPTLPEVLYGDEMRLKQVITNLLTNAVKYTERGTVTLIMKKVEAGAEDDEALHKACPGTDCPDKAIKIRMSVKDTGIGIKPEDMEKLFMEYERFDEMRNRNIEGTGLGLSIITELLDLMGSALNVESTYGSGSEFGFEIMQGVMGDGAIGDISGRFRKTPDKKKRVSFTAEDAHILVVDDSTVNLNVVKNLLKKTKINIDTAASGEEALSLVRSHEYDVILLDHLMPNMDGTETLMKMNEMKDNMSAAAPVIALTANAGANAKDEYLAAGFRDYLSKPINIGELEDMLFYHIPPEKIRTVTSE